MSTGEAYRILLADSDTAAIEPIADYLNRLGNDVTVVADADALEQCALGEMYAAIMVDLNLTGLKGISVLDALWRSQPGIPVIVTTSDPSLNSALTAFRRGAFDYLIKPYSMEDVSGTLRQACQPCTEGRTRRHPKDKYVVET